MKSLKIITFILIGILIHSLDLQAQADSTYLKEIRNELRETWPNNRTINLVFHGHSVPSGYFVTPDVRKFESYPHLSLVKIKDKYPTAVVNSITTAIGGEQAERGETRFANEVLSMRPDVLFIDYALNDRGIGLSRAKVAWQKMIDAALAHSFTTRDGEVHKVKVILMTPTPDTREDILSDNTPLAQHAAQIRQLARDNNVGLIDSYQQFKNIVARGESLAPYMAQGNHPNARGHQVVADEIAKLFVQEETVADGLYFIKGFFTERFMTVENNSEDAGARIVVQDSTNAENQKFWIKNSPDGYSITPYNSRKVLGIAGSSTQNSAELVQVDSTGSANERFAFSFATDNNFWIVNNNSNKFIATPGSQNENGTPIIQFSFFNNLNFRWSFVPAEEPQPDGRILSNSTLENKIQIFPNPAKQSIAITNNDQLVFDLSLFTTEGKLVSIYKLEKRQASLSLPENIQPGVYLLEFTGEQGSFVKRILIE